MHEILKRYDDANSFGKLLGLKLSVVEPGAVEYRMNITEKHLSNPMAAHGGAVSAMMDGILGVSALSLAVESNRLVSTVEFKLNYYCPIQLGDHLLGKGKVTFNGNRLIFSEGTIYIENKDFVIASKGLGTFNAYPASKNKMLAPSAS